MALICTFLLPPLCLLAGLWSATQWTAALLGYAPWLGAPWHGQVYLPWQFVVWFLRYERAVPAAFHRPRFAVLTGVVLGIACAWIGRLWQRGHTPPTTFGSSHWATWAGIKRSGLLGG